MAAAVIPSHGASEESLAAANVEVHIGGNVTGTLVAGNYNIVNTADGAVINVFRGKITTQRRPLPVWLRPRPFTELLDRVSEIAAATETMQRSLPFEFYAGSGWGKTVLLRHLVNHISPMNHDEGVVYERAAGYPVPDLLQFIFDAFYHTSVPLKPTEGQLRHHLQFVRALVSLDDLDLSRAEVDSLLDAVPNCVFLVASAQRNLWGEGRADALHGLGGEEGVQLFEAEVGRKLTSEERTAAELLCEAVSGQPLRLIEAAALVREQAPRRGVQVAAVAGEASPAHRLTGQVLERLTDGERRVLGLLAVLPGAGIAPEHVAAMAGLPEAGTLLRRLEQQGLVQSDRGMFRIRATLGGALVSALQPQNWVPAVVAHFVGWAEDHVRQPALLLEQSDALLAALRAAEGSGARDQVLRLVRAIEFALALAARWGQWEIVLTQGLRAAEALGDRGFAAWALHQLGTRAVCLGHPQTGVAHLRRALELRRSAGDRHGVAVTRHNLRRVHVGGWLTRLAIGAGAAVAAGIAAVVIGSQVIAGSGEATLDTQRLDLGSVPVGHATSANVTLRNTGRGGLAANSITVEGEYSQTNDCPSKRALAAGERCTITVSFTPNSAGPRNGKLIVNGTGGKASAVLTGSGLAPNLQVKPSRLEFPDVRVGQASGNQEVQLVNTGNAPLTVSDIKKVGDFDFMSACGALPTTLPAQGSCNVSVSFTPKGSGRRTGSLTFNTSSGSASVALGGRGTEVPSPTARPTPTFSPDPLDFGRQAVKAVSDARQVTLSNPAADPLSVKISTTGPFVVMTDTCLSVPAHGQCKISVSFQPTSRGPAGGNLIAVDAAGHQYRSGLSGIGLAPEASFKPPALDWTDPKALQTQSVTISNTGDTVLVISSVTVDQPTIWSTDKGCDGRQLQPGAPGCTVKVTYMYPIAKGETVTGTLTIKSNAPGTPAAVSLSGTRVPPIQ